ncbi:MAG: alpha-galactosidase [Eubacteriales bacterium]|nr:alpha-galactosidase [Eubacteriales bacterium]
MTKYLRPYPVLNTPPVAQAEVSKEYDREGRQSYTLNYGGRNIIRITLPCETKTEIRIHSDGSMQSLPLIQQFYLNAEKGTRATVTLHMREEAVCLKPGRAKGNEAILAQAGGPLPYGVNGFYGLWEDLMVEWYGAPWNWQGWKTTRLEDGSTTASFTLELTNRPFFFLIRPRYYSQHLGYRYFAPWKRRPNAKAVSGWCSWEAYHRDVTQRNVSDAAALMEELAPYGLEYIQLDDGFQQVLIPPAKDAKVCESWLTTNDKFPGGHEEITQSIRSHGLEPAIWTNAIVTNEEAAETGICATEDGKAFTGYCVEYILTCTDEVLREHVLPYYQGLREYGYSYFKTDAIRHLCFDGMQECVRRGLMTDEEADKRFRHFLECVRQGIGEETYLLSCWGILTQAVGIADACRVGTDATPEWEHIHMQITESARCFFAHRILFTLDPDHVCMRTELEWGRMLLSFISLTGELYMLSDPLECYDEPRMEMIKKTLPALDVATGETGPIDYSTPAFCWSENPKLTAEEISEYISGKEGAAFGTFWATHFCGGDRRWTVVLRTALSPLAQRTVAFEDVGLNPAYRYAAFDFWENRFLGVVTESVSLKALPIGHVQVCALTPLDDNAPTLIASDRHVSMDAVSVTGYERAPGKLNLRLKGVPGERFTYFVYSEKPCTVETDQPVTVVNEGVVTRITVRFDQEEATVEITQGE